MTRSAYWIKMLSLGAIIGLAVLGVSMRRAGPSAVASVARGAVQAAPETPALSSKQSAIRIDTVVGRMGYAPLEVTSSAANGRLEVVSWSSHINVASVPTDRAVVYDGVVSTQPGLAVGDYSGVVTVALCGDACDAANDPHVDIPYEVHVRAAPPTPVAPGEWSMYQANAAHTGYMPITVDLGKFRVKWTYSRPRGLYMPATENGRVFVSEPSGNNIAYAWAFDEETGSPIWEQAFTAYKLSPPAVKDGRVYLATTGHADTYLHALSSADGSAVFRGQFYSQWPEIFSPTIYGDVALTTGGENMFAFEADGTRRWGVSEGMNDMTTPAADAQYAYFYDASAMKVHDLATGALVRSIQDAGSTWGGYSYNAAPVLGAADHVIGFSGTNYGGRLLVDYSVASGTVRWRSQRVYVAQPAYNAGVLYSVSNDPFSFDAISEATGRVLWSWVPPTGTPNFLINGNVVLANGVAFVSTTQRVYAIDLAARKAVWSYDACGALALSPRGNLFIANKTSSSYCSTSAPPLVVIGR